jgi:hypothetical protein
MATYAAICALVEDTVENTFTADQLANFCTLAEQKIYQAVQLPALRKNVTGALTSGVKYLTLPTDFLYTYSLAVVSALGRYSYLTDKDVNYIREAYPDPTSAGVPKVYAIFDKDSLIVGPTPDAAYEVELHYGYYPESLVTAGTTGLSENFESVMFNAMLVEAARFLKLEKDITESYDKQFNDSIVLLKNWGDGKLRTDTFRTLQPRTPVK